MPEPNFTPAQKRLLEYFKQIEDRNMRALVAELVSIKHKHMHHKNRPMQKYKDKIDAYAGLEDDH